MSPMSGAVKGAGHELDGAGSELGWDADWASGTPSADKDGCCFFLFCACFFFLWLRGPGIVAVSDE